MSTKPQGHRSRMLQRKARRVFDTLRSRNPKGHKLEQMAQAISEVSGMPIADCRDQLIYWSTGSAPQIPATERCPVPGCQLRASKLAETPLCWAHVGEWVESDERSAWRAAGANPAEKQAALQPFLARYA